MRRGEEHERAVLERFRADGYEVADLRGAEDPAEATADAIRGGAAVIYQATLTGGGRGGLFGRPDFLVRADLLAAPDGERRPDGAHYEVVDAKLARSAKARAVLQTAFYSQLLAGLQRESRAGCTWRWARGARLVQGERLRRLRAADAAAAGGGHRRGPPDGLYPEPVEHCAICRWSDTCRQQAAGRRRPFAGRRDDDGAAAGAEGGRDRRPGAGSRAWPRSPGWTGWARTRSAAPRPRPGCRWPARTTGVIRYRLLEPERDAEGALVANRGLLALPEPADGDLFFDIEGARYWSEDGREFGLQYLFGVVDTADLDEAGRPRYTAFWAFDRPGEKRAFEELIDFITERRARCPGLHVYHYNHYEPTSIDHLTELHGTRQEAVGGLMGRFATREDEVDDLFRLGVFVDLYRVVRQGLQAGVESYSIKRLEPLCGYQRRVDLDEATDSLIAFEAALEDGTAAGDANGSGWWPGTTRTTAGPRWRCGTGWRNGGSSWPNGSARSYRGRSSRNHRSAEDPEIVRIRSALLDGVSADTSADERTRRLPGRARALLADLIDWHRREAKPAWWRYFYVRTLSPAELTGEPDALGELAGGEVVGPGQEVGGAAVLVPAAGAPVLRRGHGVSTRDTEKQLDGLGGGRRARDDRPEDRQRLRRPAAGGAGRSGPAQTAQLRERLRDLGDRVVRDGVGGGDAALRCWGGGRPRRAAPLRAAGETAAGRGAAGDLAARLVPAAAGTAGDREDLHRRRADPRADRAGPHGRHHRAVARGHREPDRRRVPSTRPLGAWLRGSGRSRRDNPHLHADAAMMTPNGWSGPCGTASWTWPRAPPGCGRGPGWRAAWTPCSWTRRGSCPWPTCWPWPGRPGTWCCSATRSSSPSRARPPTRRARAPRRSSTSWATGPPCPRAPGCCSTRPTGCTRTCAGTPPRPSTTGSCTGSTGWAARRSWAGRRACAWSRCRTRATPTPPRKRPARWPGWRRN